MKNLFKNLRFTFRTQLIYGLGFFLTLILSIFIYIETTNANNFTRSRALSQASDHSLALASMVQVWVMTNDYVGLEESLENFSIYKDLVFATVISMDGKIIAHTDKSLVGSYIADKNRISFLQQAHDDSEHNLVILRHGHFIDTFRVIHSGEKHIGMVHIRLDQHDKEKHVSARIYQGIGFGLLYLIIIVFLLYMIVNTFTKQLDSLFDTMKKVHAGDKAIRVNEAGNNELSQLSHEFNTMLDAIASAEVALNAVNERLEYAVNGSNDGLWDWNIETSEVYYSPRWKEMLGYMDSELPNILTIWEERIHPDDSAQVKYTVAKCHRIAGELYSIVYRMRHKDGHWVWILSRGQTIFDAEGKAVRMVGFQTDITKQKELEAEVLAQEEMMLAQSRHVAMGEMIGMIAHQWRQPITIMAMGANNLMLDVELDDVNNNSVLKEAKEILKQTEHLSKTIDDFRNFFRPNKDKDEIKVIDILRETQEIMGKSLENHNIVLSINSDEHETIHTYSRELLQVFLNLFKNAQEAIEQNGSKPGRIDATVEDKGDSLEIRVTDNGGGVEESILNRIFDPYFSTKGKKTGTGLGLYMSKTIIDKHLHGTINAHNSSAGVMFTIVIPKEIG